MFLIRHARLRRIESARLLWLALPILGAQLAQVAMGTVDVAMTGHASARDLAAVSIGSSLWLPLVLFMIGTLMGLTPATVEKHLRLARQALSVETTAQAVLKAAYQNQIFVLGR